MIRVNNLNKYYNKGKANEIHVINNTSFELPSTGLISFLGQSGSGKTTLLNVIGGLDKASGTIEYDSLLIESYKRSVIDKFRREEIGYVFQNYNLLLEESVYNNLRIALEMIDIYDKQEQDKRIEYVLKAVGMFKYRKKKAEALSGGQQQRVSIARALVKNSKIIIADEPTGNLDHENTITIMNILKKVSKTALVLVVTHNEEIASFYSDLIFNIKDGSVTDSYVPNGNEISNKNSNNVYLKDLNKEELSSDNINISYYSKEPKRIDIKIVEKNGTYYIDSSENIKLLEGSNLRLIDSHYEALTKDSLDEGIYDSSWYSTKKSKNSFFRAFINNIKEAYASMRGKGRRAKILYASFLILGLLFGINVISFSNYMLIDESSYTIDKTYMELKSTEYYHDDRINNIVWEAFLNGEIENVNQELYARVEISYKLNAIEGKNTALSAGILPYMKGRNQIISGRGVENENEIVISKGIADSIIRNIPNTFKDINALIGINAGISNINKANLTICGINDNKFNVVYMEDKEYLAALLDRGWDSEFSDGKVVRSYDIESSYDSFELIEGELPQDRNDILVSADADLEIGNVAFIKNEPYVVRGIIKMKDIEDSLPTYIVDDIVSVPIIDNLEYATEYENFKLVAGEMPKNGEVLASIYSGKKIGDKISYNSNYLTVSGLFRGTERTMGRLIGSRDTVVAYNNQGYQSFYFDMVADSITSSTFNSKEMMLDNTYNIRHQTDLKYQQENLLLYGMFSLALIIIIVVFIYFIMRSQMIQDIYPIGVYRSLGSSKWRIYKKFIYRILVTITLTTALGYILTMVFYSGISSGINDLIGAMALKNNLFIGLIGFIAIYILNLVFGLLPIILLLRKTPSEILSKYDI